MPSVLRRSLQCSTTEGMLAEVVTACTAGAVLTGYALHLGAPAWMIGLVVGAPQLAQVAHLPAAWLTNRFGARRVAITAVTLSRQLFWPLVVLPFVDMPGKLSLLGGIVALSALLGVVGNNGWTAWMGDMVPRRIRGRYFGRRTAMCTFVSAVASLAAGTALDSAYRAYVLSALALIACIAGAATTVYMLRQHDVPAPRRALHWDALRCPMARRLLAYQLAWHCAVGLAGSFFAFHMLQNLHVSYAFIAMHAAAIAAGRSLASPLWGRAIDRFGARPVLIACSFGIAVFPALYLVATPTMLWPVMLDAALSGLLWSGHALASFALPLAITKRGDRAFYHALNGSGAGIAFAIGTAVAGIAVSHVTSVQYPVQVPFAMSFIARLLAAFVACRILEPGAQPVRAMMARLPHATFLNLSAAWRRR